MFRIKMGKFHFRWCENNIETSTSFQNDPSSFASSSKIYSFFCHFVSHNTEYYKWLCRLWRHIQIDRLPFQGTWLGLLGQSFILVSMWPTDQTSNKLVINIRWWRCPLPIGPNLTLPHPNSWIETHSVFSAKIIEYAVFHLSISRWSVFIETC